MRPDLACAAGAAEGCDCLGVLDNFDREKPGIVSVCLCAAFWPWAAAGFSLGAAFCPCCCGVGATTCLGSLHGEVCWLPLHLLVFGRGGGIGLTCWFLHLHHSLWRISQLVLAVERDWGGGEALVVPRALLGLVGTMQHEASHLQGDSFGFESWGSTAATAIQVAAQQRYGFVCALPCVLVSPEQAVRATGHVCWLALSCIVASTAYGAWARDGRAGWLS